MRRPASLPVAGYMNGPEQERKAPADESPRSSMQEIAFDPADPKAALEQLPHAAGVFALYGAGAEPYIGRTPDLRSRIVRLLQPSEKHPRRLQLAGLVRHIAWRITGSDFESLLFQFELLCDRYGGKSLERMHLRMPAFVRFLGSNPYPRVVVTHRPSLRESDWAYGPFPSRTAAERFCEEMLKLFLLRRCAEDLNPDPAFPGCVYSEMKMCLAPCYKGCTDERYREEAEGVERFLATRGESRLAALRAQRDEASARLEFESAAALHAQVQKAEAVRALAPELVRPMSQLRAVILQASAQPGEVAVFLFENGRLRGPAAFSTAGMRIQNEQSGSGSLFAAPMVLEAMPEETEGTGEQGGAGSWIAPRLPRSALEARLEETIGFLAHCDAPPLPAKRQGHMALLKRWYYRPEAKRVGEICFPDAAGRWPLKSILRAIGRVAAKSCAASTRG
jgi:excinuclease ABC subunit C